MGKSAGSELDLGSFVGSELDFRDFSRLTAGYGEFPPTAQILASPQCPTPVHSAPPRRWQLTVPPNPHVWPWPAPCPSS